MSVRIYVYKDTDNRIEELGERLGISKTQVVEVAVNDYYRRILRKDKS